MPKISSYPSNGVKSSDQYIVANAGTNKKRIGILPHLYKIVPSVASNNLTVAVQDLDGNALSATTPLQTKLYDELVVIDSALSVTKNAGTNWANLGSSELATKEVDLFVYLIKETGASAGVKLGWSRIPYGTVVGDFSSTTTNEKYLAGPTNYNATDKVQNIGRFNATLSAGAGYTWSLPATSVIINIPIFHTRTLSWQPAFSAVGGGSFSSVTTTLALYQISNHWVKIQIHLSGTVTGTVTAIGATAPFESLRIGSTLPIGNAKVSGGVLGNAEMSAGTPDIILHIKYDSTAITTGASVVKSSGQYEI